MPRKSGEVAVPASGEAAAAAAASGKAAISMRARGKTTNKAHQAGADGGQVEVLHATGREVGERDARHMAVVVGLLDRDIICMRVCKQLQSLLAGMFLWTVGQIQVFGNIL